MNINLMKLIIIRTIYDKPGVKKSNLISKTIVLNTFLAHTLRKSNFKITSKVFYVYSN